MTKKNKIILTITALFAAGAVVAVPVTVRWATRPNFSKMSPRQIREYFDSNQFRDANEQTRREIRRQIGEAMQARMESQVKGYFALPEEQRTAYLDKIIDDMQARRAEFRAARAGEPNRPPDAGRFAGFGPPDADRATRFGSPDAGGSGRFGQQGAGQQRQFRRPDPARMRARAERGSAYVRVQMMQFRRALQTRMQERGIQGPMMSPGGPGGFGGPGFGPPPG